MNSVFYSVAQEWVSVLFGMLCVYSNHCKAAVIDMVFQQYLTLMMAFPMEVWMQKSASSRNSCS